MYKDEVHMDLEDKLDEKDKKFQEEDKKDKEQEEDILDKKIIDNDPYKLESETIKSFNIVMEYSSIQSLKEEKIKRIITQKSFKGSEIFKCFYQICCRVKEIHSKSMSHGNLIFLSYLLILKYLFIF